jgi:hypothetical protein
VSLGGVLAAFRRHYPGCEWRDLEAGEFLILLDEMSRTQAELERS